LTEPDDYEAGVARELADRAGGYLRNVVRVPNLTCEVCGTPIEAQYTHCWRCNQHRYTLGIADLVVPLAYCIESQQSYEVFRGYKDNFFANVRAKHMWVLERLLFLGVVYHKRCIDKRIGAKVDAYVAVPSLSGRTNPHPFVQKTTDFGLTNDSLRLVPGPSAVATSSRIVSADQFRIHPDARTLPKNTSLSLTTPGRRDRTHSPPPWHYAGTARSTSPSWSWVATSFRDTGRTPRSSRSDSTGATTAPTYAR
jgi:hypothetical protein